METVCSSDIIAINEVVFLFLNQPLLKNNWMQSWFLFYLFIFNFVFCCLFFSPSLLPLALIYCFGCFCSIFAKCPKKIKTKQRNRFVFVSLCLIKTHSQRSICGRKADRAVTSHFWTPGPLSPTTTTTATATVDHDVVFKALSWKSKFTLRCGAETLKHKHLRGQRPRLLTEVKNLNISSSVTVFDLQVSKVPEALVPPRYLHLRLYSPDVCDMRLNQLTSVPLSPPPTSCDFCKDDDTIKRGSN